MRRAERRACQGVPAAPAAAPRGDRRRTRTGDARDGPRAMMEPRRTPARRARGGPRRGGTCGRPAPGLRGSGDDRSDDLGGDARVLRLAAVGRTRCCAGRQRSASRPYHARMNRSTRRRGRGGRGSVVVGASEAVLHRASLRPSLFDQRLVIERCPRWRPWLPPPAAHAAAAGWAGAGRMEWRFSPRYRATVDAGRGSSASLRGKQPRLARAAQSPRSGPTGSCAAPSHPRSPPAPPR
jgi:hypothetical protein